jgi:site-specific recombinase XerD
MDNERAKELFTQHLNRRYGDRSTPKHYLSDVSIFLKTLGKEQRLVDMVPQDIERFIEKQQESGMSAGTINRRLAAFHTCFECLAAELGEEARPNPVIWRRHKVKEGELLPRDASDRQVEQLLSVMDADSRDRAMFELMVGAGLRVGEVAQLRLCSLQAPSTPEQMARLRVWGKGHKERIVWLTPKTYAQIERWLTVRAASTDDHLFLNQHGQAMSTDGIQYRLRQHCQKAEVYVTCHQLRHTFARRLAEQRMPIESISKLLGHAQVETTQRYTAGADPQLREEFQQAMAQLEAGAISPPVVTQAPGRTPPPRREEQADRTQLEQALARFAGLPSWLSNVLGSYLRKCWYKWSAHMAGEHAHRLARQLVRIWRWFLDNRSLTDWSDLQRSDLEAWLSERQAAKIGINTQRNELSTLLACLHFAVEQELAISAQLFRVAYPAPPTPLPRDLSYADYVRLVETVLAHTCLNTAADLQARAWFLTLAHTGIRVSELLNLRLADLDLEGGRLFIRTPKNGRERIVFLTPGVIVACQQHLAQRPLSYADHLWGQENRPLTANFIRHCLRNWGKLCDVAVSPHQLRHTFATQLINQGLPLASVAKLLGHNTLHMTQRYARLYDSTVKEQFLTAAAHIEGIAVSNWPISTTTQLVTLSVDSV